jgi:hypothetical protein
MNGVVPVFLEKYRVGLLSWLLTNGFDPSFESKFLYYTDTANFQQRSSLHNILTSKLPDQFALLMTSQVTVDLFENKRFTVFFSVVPVVGIKNVQYRKGDQTHADYQQDLMPHRLQ